MPNAVKPNIVKYSLQRSFLLSAATVVFVLIVATVAFAFGATAITVAVAGGLLASAIVLVGSLKMRARLKRELQGESKSQHPRA